MLTRFFYSVLFGLLLPLALLRLLWRSRLDPDYRKNIGERLGLFPQAKTKNAIWVHAVSVGEMRAALPLITALAVRYPTRPILISNMTPTGRATANELIAPLRAAGSDITTVYLPYDLAVFMRRLLLHFSPSILVVMETEIWPNLIAVCREEKIPVALVNARLSARSAARYQRWAPGLAREALTAIRAVAAQSEDDATRFGKLGAVNLVVTGSMKFDVLPDAAMLALGAHWRAGVGTRLVLLAASTREGEEKLLLDAYRDCTSAEFRSRTLLVIVPRHPPRVSAVAELIAAMGLTFNRRSSTGPDGSAVWLGDSLGELFAYFALCDIAFIGGSLVPVGGHNLIEAAALGKPILMGASRFNFAEAAAAAEAAGALHVVGDARGWIDECLRLANDPAKRRAMGQAAQMFAAAHRGATDKTCALIAGLLESR